MRFALYGMPCAGKSTALLSMKKPEHVHGSELLKELARKKFGRDFRSLAEREQDDIRRLLINEIKSRDNIIVDGHYAFGEKVVFTEADGECYDVFLYLYEDPDILRERISKSGKNVRFVSYDLATWQTFEIESLRRYCLVHGKDYYVVDKREYLRDFIQVLSQGFSTTGFAERVAREIAEKYQGFGRIYLLDGDKTVSSCDISRTHFRYKTGVFDGNFYSGFQFWLQAREFVSMRLDAAALDPAIVPINKVLMDSVDPAASVLLTCGHPAAWTSLTRRLGIPICASGPEMSADAKFHIVRFLRKLLPDVELVAHGDSLSDLYMLKETEGVLWVKNRLSQSLVGRDISGVPIRYIPWILADEDCSMQVKELCMRSKSNSGVCGNELAEVHERIGERLGEVLSRDFDAAATTMVCMLRGGLFLARGIYRNFNCKFLLLDPHLDHLEGLDRATENVLLVDSVINTGDSVLRTISKISARKIIVAAGVIQREALSRFCKYQLYVCRVSENKFKGVRCKVQTGAVGPDTSDRLFNLI